MTSHCIDHEHGTRSNLKRKCAEKVGLQIYFENTAFFGTKLEKKELHTKYGYINRVHTFKYLGQVVDPTGKEETAPQTMYQNMKIALGNIRNLYNKKCLSMNTKIRHYNTMIKPEIMYVSETLPMT